MPIKISDYEDFNEKVKELDLKPLASAQQVCTSIIAHAYHTDGQRKLTIRIHLSLLPESYAHSAAMFGHNLKLTSPYTCTQAFRDGEYIKIVCGDSMVPRSFRQRALIKMKLKGRYAPKAATIPKAYKKRPELLAYYLGKETGRAIAIIANRQRIVWKFS